ncbi:MAG: S8 family serine peptidase [candidate division WOR-3 bacterium]
MIQILIIFCNLYNYRPPIGDKIDPKCFEKEFVRAWVFFTDKGVTVSNYNNVLLNAKKYLNPASLLRRNLRNGIFDFGDIPIKEEYIEEIQNSGGILLYRSKWLNAASFILTRDNLTSIASYDFVYRITPVAQYNKIIETEITLQDTTGALTNKQLQMFKIDSLHKIGVFGSNVKIGFLDTGLRRTHIALESLKVIAEYDFLGGDQIYLENIPVTARYGVYTDLLYHKRSNRDEIFLIGDTSYVYMPVRDILWTYSDDGGTSWSELRKITNNANNNWISEFAHCGNDTTFLFFRNRNGMNFVALDTGIIAGPITIIGGGEYRNPRAVMYNDTAYFFYRDKHNIFLRKGNINGFPDQILVISESASIKLSSVITGVQKLGIFYYHFPNDSLFFAWSTIPTDTFYQKFTGFIGKDLSATSSGDTIFAIFKDASISPFYRICFIRSIDFGNNFTTPLYLSDQLNSIGKISLFRNSNVITAVWESNGRIYQRISYDDGMSFSPVDSINKEFVYLPTLGLVSGEIKKFYCQRGDDNTDGYNPADPNYFHPRHGTEMLGIVGGYARGSYIGVAPGAQFIVAKTENPDSLYEFPIEEDTYIAGLEWAESQGADIVSSSLGYTNWYNWPNDYDGKTSPASIAVYEATKRGVIVVTASGNVAIPQLVIPGDAIDAITVGGIDSTFQRWRYSGRGPTYDGRLKPEIVCLSAAPVVVNPDEKNSYLLSFGTSGATALAAGICALLLEGHPRWTVDSLRKALFETASFANSPSDSIGYGWPDAAKAFYYTQPVIKPSKDCEFLTPFPNPFTVSAHNSIYLPFILNTKTYVELRIYSITGRLIKKIEINKPLAPGRYTDTNPLSPNAAFIWDGKDENGNYVGSGVYYCFLYTYGAGNDVTKIVVVK